MNWIKKNWLLVVLFCIPCGLVLYAAWKLKKDIGEVLSAPGKWIAAAFNSAASTAASVAHEVAQDVTMGNAAVSDSVTGRSTSGYFDYLFQNNPIAWSASWLGGATSDY